MPIRWQHVLSVMIFLLSAVSVSAQDYPETARLTLDQSLHFLDKEGSDILLPPGTYRLESTESRQLRLSSEATTAPRVIVDAIELSHDKDLTTPAAGIMSTDEDSVHVVLFLPGGTALDATGSRSSVRSRAGALTSKQLAQVGIAPNEIKRLTESFATLLPVEKSTGTKTAGSLPSCVQSSQGVECFVQSMASPPSLLTAVFARGQWSPWTSLGGSITSAPSCFNPGPGFPSGMENITCIALGLNSRLWLLKKAGGQWTANWQLIDFDDNIYAPDGVSCLLQSRTDIYSCYARNKTKNQEYDQIYTIRYSDPNRPEKSGWSRWERMVSGVGAIHSKPECLEAYVPASHQVPEYWNRLCYGWRSGQLVRFWHILIRPSSSFVPDHRNHNLPNPPSWTEYSGQIAAPPSCIESGETAGYYTGVNLMVVCAALKSDGSLVYRRATDPGSNLWQSVAGSALAGPPSCLTGGTCFAIGQDQKLWRFDLGVGGTPTRSARVSGNVPLLPRVTCVRAGNFHCFATAMTTNDLMHYQITP